MSILPSSASLLARQVRLMVTPPTNTLLESRAILSQLESSFGAVTTFINQRNDPVLRRLLKSGPVPDGGGGGGGPTTTTPTPTTTTTATTTTTPSFETILAVFMSPASQQSALQSGRLVVSCGGRFLPSGEELDPYNARGLQDRQHPPHRTLTCHIQEEKGGEDGTTIHRRLVEQNPYWGAFRHDTLQISYMDLVLSGVPLSDMADVMRTERTLFDGMQHEKGRRGDNEPQATPSMGFYFNNSRLGDPQHNGGLMTAWKWAVEKEKGEQKPEDGSDTAPEMHDTHDATAEFKNDNHFIG